MTDEYYSYREALEIVEGFMVRSGIREYCVEICRGECCDTETHYDPKIGKEVKCWESDWSCRVRGRRLACSIYICKELQYLLPDGEMLKRLNIEIYEKLFIHIGRCAYFPDNEYRDTFHIEKSILEPINLFNVFVYRSIINYLIRKNIKVYKRPIQDLIKIKEEIKKRVATPLVD